MLYNLITVQLSINFLLEFIHTFDLLSDPNHEFLDFSC